MPSPDSWLHRRFEWGAGWVIEGPVAVTKAGGHGARRAVEREEVFVERWTQRADPCGLGRNYKLSYQVLLLTETETESDIHPPAFDIQEQSGSGICINLWGVDEMYEGCQKVQTSSYKINESWRCKVFHGDHS